MDDHTFIQSRIPLLPDAALRRMIEEMLANACSPQQRSRDAEQHTRSANQMEAISREIKARGMSNPPWWSARRDWEIEDLPISVRNGVGSFGCPA